MIAVRWTAALVCESGYRQDTPKGDAAAGPALIQHPEKQTHFTKESSNNANDATNVPVIDM